MISTENRTDALPERFIEPGLKLTPYYPAPDLTLAWYQDTELCMQVDRNPDPYTPERLNDMYSFLSTHGNCYYIEYEGIPVGDVTLRDNGELCIVICREYQNRHIGRKCIGEMLQLAEEKGLEKVTANIYDFNLQSRNMFQSVGFVQTSEEWFEYRFADHRMTVNGKEYRVLKLLGKGKGGYSYLVSDHGNRYVLKQIHHEPCAYYSFGDKLQSELRDYRRLSEIGIRMPRLLETDPEQERILKEFIDGDTVFDLVLKDRNVKDAENQVREMCRLLYPAGTNIDYFPTNFVLSKGLLYYIDYECNDYMEQWNYENWGVRYWSRTEEFNRWLTENRPELSVN